MADNPSTANNNSHASAARFSRKQSEVIKALRAELTQAAAMEAHLRELLADLHKQLEKKSHDLTNSAVALASSEAQLAQCLLELETIKNSRLMRYKQLLVGGAKPRNGPSSGLSQTLGSAAKSQPPPTLQPQTTAANKEDSAVKNPAEISSEELHSAAVPSEKAASTAQNEQSVKPEQLPAYQARIRFPLKSNRPKIVHALAHFRMGGSSQLVVDIFERLGHLYDQQLLILEAPDPVAYEGVQYTSGLEHRKDLENFLREQNPDLLHIHYWHSPLHEKWYSKVFDAAEAHGCLLVQNVNTPVTPHYTPALDQNVYVSGYVKKTFGKEGEKARVIYPGSDFQLFDRADDEPLGDCIGMVYRLQPDKLNLDSINVFIEAAKISADAKFLIVGGGKLLAPYKEAVARAQLSERFEFTDFVSYADLPKYYRRLRVFVAPIWKESFGQVSPFALHMRVPVVGFATGAIPEIVRDESLLAEPGNPKALGKIAADLFNDPKRCIAVGSMARDYAQANFSVEKMIEQYEELYAQLLTANAYC